MGPGLEGSFSAAKGFEPSIQGFDDRDKDITIGRFGPFWYPNASQKGPLKVLVDPG